jgi:hypothetical protein
MLVYETAVFDTHPTQSGKSAKHPVPIHQQRDKNVTLSRNPLFNFVHFAVSFAAQSNFHMAYVGPSSVPLNQPALLRVCLSLHWQKLR